MRFSYFRRAVALPIQHLCRFENLIPADGEANTTPLDTLAQLLINSEVTHDICLSTVFSTSILALGPVS